ncbi:hypothetical protein CGRA01v4_11901 [Colletotrichum graminicola]|nr:hypothetical protein CGRA01v4_11901 [Colletotrichum graminicola]
MERGACLGALHLHLQGRDHVARIMTPDRVWVTQKTRSIVRVVAFFFFFFFFFISLSFYMGGNVRQSLWGVPQQFAAGLASGPTCSRCIGPNTIVESMCWLCI